MKKKKLNLKKIEEKIKRFLAPTKEPLRVVDYYIDDNGEPKNKSDFNQNFC